MSEAPRRLRCRPEDHGRKIEKVLMRTLEVGPDRAHKLLRQRRVWLIEPGPVQPLARGAVLRHGDLLELRPGEPSEPRPPQPNRKVRLEVLEQDAELIVLAKPAGRVVHPGPQHGTDSLLNGLVAAYPELLELGEERGWGLVHRLDRDTSGVLLVTRTPAAYDAIRAAWAARQVRKTYQALVKGAPPAQDGLIELPLEGQEARTRYRLEETRGRVSLLTLWPETGRTHQLRLHLAALGCPILADARHGDGLDEVTARLFLTRHALHASELALEHPAGTPRVWSAPWPRDLRKAWKRAQE